MQPVFATLSRKDGLEILGAAFREYLVRMSGVELPGHKYAAALADTVAEMGIVDAIAALHGNPIASHHGADDGNPMVPHHGADDGSPILSPFTPKEGKNEGKKIPSFLPLNSGKKEGMGFSSAPSFEEWAEQARSIGWDDAHAVKDSFDWRAHQGWGEVKNWKRLCTCLANNWKVKRNKSASVAGAFGGGK